MKVRTTFKYRQFVIPMVLAGAFVSGVGALAHGPQHNPSRHQYIMQNGVPEVYEGLVNPLSITADNLSGGDGLYEQNCASCHGAKGEGDAASAKDLDPPPADLTGMYDRPMTGMGQSGAGAHLMHGMMHHHPGMTHADAMGGLNMDAYTYWAVSEGGEAMGSSMPAFKELLSEDERWQIILFIANDFSAEHGN